MSFYNSLDNVEKYIKMCAGYVPDELIEILTEKISKSITNTLRQKFNDL